MWSIPGAQSSQRLVPDTCPKALKAETGQLPGPQGHSELCEAVHASQAPGVNAGRRPRLSCLQGDSAYDESGPQRPGLKGCHKLSAQSTITSVRGLRTETISWGEV